MNGESGVMRMLEKKEAEGGEKQQNAGRQEKRWRFIVASFCFKDMLFLKMTLSEHSHPCNFGKSTNDT